MTETTMAVAPGAFRVGAVFGRAFEVLSRNFVKFFLLTAIAWSPLLLLTLYIGGGVGRGASATGIGAASIVTVVLIFVLGILSQAVILYGSFQDMRHQPFDIGQSLAKGLARFFPIIGLSICMVIGLMFGFILLVVPGFILWTMWSVALPVCIVEGLGPIASLSRSGSLTKGNRWKVFGIMIVLALVGGVAGAILQFLFAKLTGAALAAIGMFVWRAIYGAYQAIAIAILYHDLRAAKEGIDIDRIASVFD